MLRFISRLFKIDYDSCKSCETLRQQLDIMNEQNKELMKTMISIVKPEIINPPVTITDPLAMKPAAASWARRRAFLEERDRNAAQASSRAAKPDEIKLSIEALETELGVEEGAS